MTPGDSTLSRIDPLDPLLGPPSRPSEPVLDPLMETLPIGKGMGWENFEILLVRIGRDFLGLRSLMKFGNPGQAQKGIDLIGIDPDGKAIAIQSKRRESFTLAKLDEAVTAFTSSGFEFPVPRLIIGVASKIAERKFVERLIALNHEYAPLEIELWDQDRILEILRSQPQIVTEFFGTAAAARFCAPHSVTTVDVADVDAVETADAVMRGPLIAAGVGHQLKQAEVAAESDAQAALDLYQQVQTALVERGFPGHAAKFDSPISKLLIDTGRIDDALRIIMNRVWKAERAADLSAVQGYRREARALFELDNSAVEDRSRSNVDAVAFAIDVVCAILSSVVPESIDIEEATLAALPDTDRGQLLLLIAEYELGNDHGTWITENAQLLTECAACLPDDDAVSVRLRLAVADVDNNWTELVKQARISLPKDLSALVHARHASYLVRAGRLQDAEDSWGEAISCACLTRHYSDAISWLYSQRAVAQRHRRDALYDSWHPVARELRDLPSRPPLTTAAQDIREQGLAAVHHDSERVGAIRFRRYLRDALASGTVSDERDARLLLGDVYSASRHFDLAARQYILGGHYEHTAKAAQSLGDTYLDVRSYLSSPNQWIAAAALHFLAEQADLVPDADVADLVDIALNIVSDLRSGARSDSPILSPKLYEAAYLPIAALAERLPEHQASTVVDQLSDHVVAPPHAGFATDDSHIRITAALSARRNCLRTKALEQLVGLFARAPYRFGQYATDALANGVDIVGDELRTLATERYHDAAAVLALNEFPSPEQAAAAVASLCTPTTNGPGHYTVGTRVVDDSILVRHLPAEDRIECVRTLLANAQSPYEGADDRTSYHLAACNLIHELSEDTRSEFYELAMRLAQRPPISEPDIIHKSMGDPLGVMQWKGVADAKPSAALLAARLAADADEKIAVRDLVFQLIATTTTTAGHSRLADALRALSLPLDDYVQILAGSAHAPLRGLAAAVWAESGDLSDAVAEPLARDDDRAVRRALAHQIADQTAPRFSNVKTILAGDPRWSIRRILVSDRD